MSSPENDLMQSLLAECRRKDEKIAFLNEELKIAEKHIENLRNMLKQSMKQTDDAIEIANKILK